MKNYILENVVSCQFWKDWADTEQACLSEHSMVALLVAYVISTVISLDCRPIFLACFGEFINLFRRGKLKLGEMWYNANLGKTRSYVDP